MEVVAAIAMTAGLNVNLALQFGQRAAGLPIAGPVVVVQSSGPAFLQDAGPATPDEKPKKKSKNKNAKVTQPAPDDAGDDEPDTDAGGGSEEARNRFVWKTHPSWRYGSIFRLDLQARLQEDAHVSHPAAPGLQCSGAALPTPCVWELHRSRIGIQGNLFNHIDYEVERELTEQELTDKQLLEGEAPKSQWTDVNVNVDYIKNAQVKVGRFKIPFGLDELTGVTHNDFAYRSLGANYLASGRDVGLQVHGRFFKRGLEYLVGVFAHDGDNARSKKIQGGDQTLAWRVSATPLRKLNIPMLEGLEVGTAFAISALSDDAFRPNGFRGRTLVAQDTFYESVYVKGHRRRWEADVDWTVGPGSIRAEYTQVADDRLRQGLADQDLPDARARSWYVSGTWVLTGEDKKRPLKADHDFLQGGFGAVELAVRYERLWFDSVDAGADAASRSPRAETIRPSGDRALTLGVNWTVNRFIKLQVNGIREHVEDPSRNPIANGAAFWSRVLRLQFVL